MLLNKYLRDKKYILLSSNEWFEEPTPKLIESQLMVGGRSGIHNIFNISIDDKTAWVGSNTTKTDNSTDTVYLPSPDIVYHTHCLPTVKLVLYDVVEDLQQKEDEVVVVGRREQEPGRGERLEKVQQLGGRHHRESLQVRRHCGEREGRQWGRRECNSAYHILAQNKKRQNYITRKSV